jgi:transcriptional regulator with XRE-family HTH domain
LASQFITKGYAELLSKAVAAVQASKDLTKGDLADKLGMGRTTLHRLENGASDVSVEKATAAHQGFQRHFKVKLPPPVVPVESADHYELIELAADLAREDPEYLARVVTKMRQRRDGLRLIRDANRELEANDD